MRPTHLHLASFNRQNVILVVCVCPAQDSCMHAAVCFESLVSGSDPVRRLFICYEDCDTYCVNVTGPWLAPTCCSVLGILSRHNSTGDNVRCAIYHSHDSSSVLQLPILTRACPLHRRLSSVLQISFIICTATLHHHLYCNIVIINRQSSSVLRLVLFSSALDLYRSPSSNRYLL